MIRRALLHRSKNPFPRRQRKKQPFPLPVKAVPNPLLPLAL